MDEEPQELFFDGRCALFSWKINFLLTKQPYSDSREARHPVHPDPHPDPQPFTTAQLVVSIARPTCILHVDRGMSLDAERPRINFALEEDARQIVSRVHPTYVSPSDSMLAAVDRNALPPPSFSSISQLFAHIYTFLPAPPLSYWPTSSFPAHNSYCVIYIRRCVIHRAMLCR